MNYADWPLSAPVNLTWEITRQCNLSCVHCLSESTSTASGELDLAACKGIVDQLAALKVFEINFGGGEPLLCSFFVPLLRYIHARGIVTCISTNGTIINDEALDCFKGNPLVNIQVSLDGATAKVNDKIRGQGTFRHVINNIERFAGTGAPLSINTVVTSLNFGQLAKLKLLAGSYGARLRVSRFRPSGRARQSWEALRLNPGQLRLLSAWLDEDTAILTGDSFFAISGDGRRHLGLDMCGAFKMTCCIDPFGGVYPCAFLQADEFCAGNLRTTSFKNIWDNSPVCLFFRKLAPASCSKCPRFNDCRGGCPAVAYFIKRDLNMPDPECIANWGTVAPLSIQESQRCKRQEFFF